jgi:hypothetical protein
MKMGLWDMNFYVMEDPDGTIHVQNAVMGHYGQHHVHTKEDFKKWAKDISKENLIDLKTKCGCGMKAGQTVDGNPKRPYPASSSGETFPSEKKKKLTGLLVRKPSLRLTMKTPNAVQPTAIPIPKTLQQKKEEHIKSKKQKKRLRA